MFKLQLRNKVSVSKNTISSAGTYPEHNLFWLTGGVGRFICCRLVRQHTFNTKPNSRALTSTDLQMHSVFSHSSHTHTSLRLFPRSIGAQAQVQPWEPARCHGKEHLLLKDISKWTCSCAQTCQLKSILHHCKDSSGLLQLIVCLQGSEREHRKN